MKNKRVYIFDWDDNIIHMPTTIKMEKLIDGKWNPINLSTSEYASVRGTDNFRFPLDISDPFINFSNNTQFIEDLQIAIDNKSFGPSFVKFKECLIHGHDFAIITARGQSINVIMAGIISIIGKTFYTNELTMMIENVKDINHYLLKQTICPVSSSDMEFTQLKYGELKDSIELRKILSLDTYVDKMMNRTDEIEFDGKFSIGISDDDRKNITTIKDFIEKALKPKYPKIRFAIYDTSDPNNIIKRHI